jgi:hypothetical protein
MLVGKVLDAEVAHLAPAGMTPRPTTGAPPNIPVDPTSHPAKLGIERAQ